MYLNCSHYLFCRLGLDVIDSAFERIELGDRDDSDSDEGDQRLALGHVLEPKDPYIHRPLPFIIGSASFMQDDDVGLRDYFSGEILSSQCNGYTRKGFFLVNRLKKCLGLLKKGLVCSIVSS